MCFDRQSPKLFTMFASKGQNMLPRQVVLTEKHTAGCEGLLTISQSFHAQLSPPDLLVIFTQVTSALVGTCSTKYKILHEREPDHHI